MAAKRKAELLGEKTEPASAVEKHLVETSAF
jgi:hypothetical protein